MDFKENMTALELYEATKSAGNEMRAGGKKHGSVNISERPKVNVSGYAVKVGPDVYGLPSVEVSETKGGKTRILCVLPFTDYLKLRHVSKGDKVVISGNILGYTPEYDIVVVKQSKIASVNGKKP